MTLAVLTNQEHLEVYQRGDVFIYFAPAEELYESWPTPTCIVADGPYGLNGYPGDLPSINGIAGWYQPHIAAWTKAATPETTLWFWNTELGWATVHPMLVAAGWEYRSCHVWDKGLGHVAGNANSKTLRKFPVTTEVCVQYVKRPLFGTLTAQEWLRQEWLRSGLPLRVANEACQVANAATRKYLTADHMWYFPPPEAFEALAAYANLHGDPGGFPYFSLDGKRSLSAAEWSRQRAKFRCEVGLTNVWRLPHVGGAERVEGSRSSMQWKYRSLHGSQKPLALIDIAIAASTDPGDTVWEPFGGLCPAAICASRSGRACRSAEIVDEFYEAAVARLASD